MATADALLKETYYWLSADHNCPRSATGFISFDADKFCQRDLDGSVVRYGDCCEEQIRECWEKFIKQEVDK